MNANAKRNKVIGLIGMIVLSIVITCGVNKQYTFGAGFIQSYIFFNAFSLFDALVRQYLVLSWNMVGDSGNRGYDRSVS